MRNRIIIFCTCLFLILLSACSIHIPFFWDGTFFSEAAVHFFEGGFNGFVPQQQADTGGFPFYSAYLTMAWRLFGKNLVVSHLAMLPFLIAIVYFYLQVASRFLNSFMIPFAMLLLVSEPVLLTQTVLMGYDLCILCFFLFALKALLDGKENVFRIALALLCLNNIRGIMLGLSLIILDIVIHRRTGEKLKIKWKNYLTAFVCVAGWAIYHYAKTGWLFFSPLRENDHESILPLSMMVRQFLFICWKIADFGRIALWLFLWIAGNRFYKNIEDGTLRKLALILFIPLVTLSVFMIPIANPIGHKYFLPVFLCLNIGVCFLIQQLKSRPLQVVLALFFSACMISGNFWLYPERLGNGWDSSLKVLPYFTLKKQMDSYIKEQKINTADIGTQFPLISDDRYSYLSDTSFHYNNIWKGPISKYNYFLFSNVINTDIPRQVEWVKQHLVPIKKITSGSVYIELYKIN